MTYPILVIVVASSIERKGSYTCLRVFTLCTFCIIRGEPKHLKSEAGSVYLRVTCSIKDARREKLIAIARAIVTMPNANRQTRLVLYVFFCGNS